jgi:hypothetical protein
MTQAQSPQQARYVRLLARRVRLLTVVRLLARRVRLPRPGGTDVAVPRSRLRRITARRLPSVSRLTTVSHLTTVSRPVPGSRFVQ